MLTNTEIEIRNLPYLNSPQEERNRIIALLQVVKQEVDQVSFQCGSQSPCSANTQPPSKSSRSRSSSNQSAPGSLCDDTCSVDSRSSSWLPQVLKDYFEYVRQVNLWKERIEEHDCITAEGSEQVSREWNDRNLLLCKLQATEQVANRQRAECLAQGVDPELHRYRRLSDSSAC